MGAAHMNSDNESTKESQHNNTEMLHDNNLTDLSIDPMDWIPTSNSSSEEDEDELWFLQRQTRSLEPPPFFLEEEDPKPITLKPSSGLFRSKSFDDFSSLISEPFKHRDEDSTSEPTEELFARPRSVDPTSRNNEVANVEIGYSKPLPELPPFCNPILTKKPFTVVFTKEAVVILKDIAQVLELHPPFRGKIDEYDPVPVPEFNRSFEQKFAMYIGSNLKYRVERALLFSLTDYYVITEIDVIKESTALIQEMLNRGYNTFPPQGTIQHMLNGYPISLLSQVCGATLVNAHIIGESVKRLIELRKTYPRWMPDELQLCTQGNCPLTGHKDSPLNQEELDALYRYLGSRKNIYVNLLLNCLFELSRHESFLNIFPMTSSSILTVGRSSWFYLFLFAHTQNESYKYFSTINICPNPMSNDLLVSLDTIAGPQRLLS